LEKLPSPDEAVKAKDFSIGKGGGALNYSVAVSRYGQIARLIGVTSRIFPGLGFLEELKKEGVDIRSIRILEDGTPGFSTILNVEGEQRRLITYRGVNTKLNEALVIEGLKSEPLPKIAHFSSVNPSLLEGVLNSIGNFRDQILISYDPGTETRGNEEKVLKVAERVDVIFLNESEAERIFGNDAEERIKRASYQDRKKIFVLKKGARGGTAYIDGKAYSAVAPSIAPVDTTGAGDAFDAAFNSCYAEEKEVQRCIEVAVVAGSLKSLRRGSSSSPYFQEIEDFLKKSLKK